ncbi:MAG: hypothetical protein KDC54_21640 [Lewinella sp.]|nr:hypothetical protein [Lewinella sp.]
MKPSNLFPHTYKRRGWFLLLPGLVLGIIYLTFEPEPAWLDWPVFALFDDPIIGNNGGYMKIVANNVFDEITGLLLIIGALLVAFSKEKFEDEFIARIRLESLVWATYVNYFVLVLAILFVYGLPFFWVLVFNMFTMLFFFIIRFNWVLRRARQLPSDEK